MEASINDSNAMEFLVGDPKRKYYVYRLVDPRTLQTFYVGKGCGDRANQHVKNVKSLLSKEEDLEKLKEQRIAEILGSGKEVIVVIHRHGLTEKEALEVEAALMDCYPGLTNRQGGYGIDRGATLLDDLLQPVYFEPKEDYIIIKTTPGAIQVHGGLYEATRKAWTASLNRAKKYKYVLSVVYGVVREVYEVERWYSVCDRIAFVGKPANGPITSLKKHQIPQKYKGKGMANPFLYKK